MTRATGRIYRDADSHLMELPDFLARYADPQYRDAIPRIAMDSERQRAALGDAIERGCHSPETVARLVARGAEILSGPKDYFALGAFNGGERSQALDLLGFASQVVFPSFSEVPAFYGEGPLPVRYAIARALNRAMAAFCEGDKRLLGVGILPIGDPELARAELEVLIGLGLRNAWIPHQGPPGFEFRARALEPLWARMADAGVVLIAHILPPADIVKQMTGDGVIIPLDSLEGDEEPRGEKVAFSSDHVQTFLTKLIFEGVFERHPRLRCAVTEFGGHWVPGLMNRLDALAERIFDKSGPAPRRAPSAQILDHCLFTPYHHEDVGALIRRSDSRLYAFSSDYPHIEGGTDPIGQFEASLTDCTEAEREQFYSGNFARIFGP